MQGCPERPLPWGRAGRVACAALVSLGGCHVQHAQSMLHTASEASEAISWLWWCLLAICGAVFILVMALVAVAVLQRRQDPQLPAPLGNRFILINGAVVPAAIVMVILLASVKTQVALHEPESDLTIDVVGHQWWWEVSYPLEGIKIANEIYLPVGESVRLQLTSADVVHSLWIPNLHGKTDLLPGKFNTMWLAANRAGTYRGQCAEYCGVQHALMGMRVTALPRDEFDAWVRERQESVVEPLADAQQRGRRVFVEAKCGNCHAVGDTPAGGGRGPDLTHIGTRQTIGAGLLANNRDNLAGWIANPQALKPGNRMPPTNLEPDDLNALVEYLESLR